MELRDIVQCLTSNFDIEKIMLDNTEDTKHYVKHKFRDEIIVPLVAVTANFSFITGKGQKEVITTDNVCCKVVDFKYTHICDLQEKIKELYNIEAWNFIMRWYKSEPMMDSMHFLVIKLNKK